MHKLRPGAVISARELMTTWPSAASGGGAGQPRDRTGLARAVTELLAPANLAVAQLLLVGWHGTPGPTGLGWGLLAATFCGLLPYGVVIAGVRRRRWTDRHLRVRQQRPVPFLAGIASVLAGLAMLLALDAPRQLVALVAAMLAGLAATLVVTLWWKLSVHTAAAGGTVAILALTFGPALTLTAPRSRWWPGRGCGSATTPQPRPWPAPPSAGWSQPPSSSPCDDRATKATTRTDVQEGGNAQDREPRSGQGERLALAY